MKPSYQYLEHTADVLFIAKGNTPAEMFEQAGLAVEETMINLKKVSPAKKVKIKKESNKIDSLLFDFLDELVFLKDYKQLVFSKFEVKIEEKKEKFKLEVLAYGEKIDNQKHEPKVDIKAITMHMFKVEKSKDSWQAQVLVDI